MNYKTEKKQNIKNFVDSYFNKLENCLKKIPSENIQQACNLILKTVKNKNTIYVCGNGGSAAIANHYVCDYFKQLSKYTSLKAKIKSLNSDTYLISAISNDLSYDQIFKIQAERLMKKNDILILISSSGNSKNIKNVLKYCNEKKIKTIGFSNFSGGYLKKNSYISIHSKINNYGIGEDINHILMHLIMQYISSNNLQKKFKKIVF
tara:strand:+ start:95 stop:712 length:618 start_codon:yes stop_codon:yes gene_type:complete